MPNECKKTSPIVLEHWKFKFDKSIRILLENGVSAEELIRKIKAVKECNDGEKN
jgi:hypothetical protein